MISKQIVNGDLLTTRSRFLSHPFQFIIQQLSYHSAMYNITCLVPDQECRTSLCHASFLLPWLQDLSSVRLG